MSLTVGFDVGGSTVRAGLVVFERETSTGWRILDQRRELLDPSDKRPEVVASVIRRLFESLVGDVSPSNQATDIGIGLCGQMTNNGRFVANAPNLGWQNVAFADLLEKELEGADTPAGMTQRSVKSRPGKIRIDNDLNAILLGEQQFGAAVGCRNVDLGHQTQTH